MQQITDETIPISQPTPAICDHRHSITGDFDMIKRLLPDYAAGPAQDGYMLDICKKCMKALPERPYNANRYRQKDRH